MPDLNGEPIPVLNLRVQQRDPSRGYYDVGVDVDPVDELFAPWFDPPERPRRRPILAADRWRANAHLIADVYRLGYISDDWSVLDMTYGEGKWWLIHLPFQLVTNDLYKPAQYNWDYRHLPDEWTDLFATVAFDPPYVAMGGRGTSTMTDMKDRYGMRDAPATPARVQTDVEAGLCEAARVCRPGGTILVKVKNYISSNRYVPGVYNTQKCAEGLGLEALDIFYFITPGVPQPPGRRQRHSRNNLSQLLVYRKPA